MGWFLCDRDLRHERIDIAKDIVFNTDQQFWYGGDIGLQRIALSFMQILLKKYIYWGLHSFHAFLNKFEKTWAQVCVFPINTRIKT